MNALTRIRIILFALMVVGAFANFALNEWGNAMIIYCELLMTISFFAEIALVLVHRLKNKKRLLFTKIHLGLVLLFLFVNVLIFIIDMNEFTGLIYIYSLLALMAIGLIEGIYDFFTKTNNHGNFENTFLATFFVALLFKNQSMFGAGELLVLSGLCLLPYYITTTIKFVKSKFKLGKALITILTIGSLSTIFFGLFFIFKTMHWPMATILFYLALILSIIMILGSLKWYFIYDNNRISIIKGLRLFNTHIILIYFIAFTFCMHAFLANMGWVPKYFSQTYPASIYKLRESGMKKDEERVKHDQIREAYDNFISSGKKNGFIK